MVVVRAGQLVTVAAHEVMVKVSVVRYVEVEVTGAYVDWTWETGQTVV